METKLHGIIHQILQIKITDFIFLVYQNRSLHLGIDHSNQLIRWNRLGKSESEDEAGVCQGQRSLV